MNLPYKVKQNLGKGANGITFLIDYHGEDAVLKWPLTRHVHFTEEANTMNKLHSRYCVHIKEVVNQGSRTGIVMEYCPHKSLNDILEKCLNENKKLSKRGILKLFCEIVLGLKYLHDHNVLHLDLKPENIFITQDNMCVLGDFGLSKEVEDLEQSLRGPAGTPIYNAPEQLLGRESYHASADIYSLGLILYEMCTLERFYEGARVMNDLIRMNREVKDASKNPRNRFFKERLSKIPRHVPKELIKIIIKCLQYEPTDRPTINDIYHEEIIQEYIKNGIEDFLKDYDSKENTIIEDNWKDISKICKEDYIIEPKIEEKILYIFSHYKGIEFMLEEEKANMWKLIRFLSKNIGYQLLLDPHDPSDRIKYYKTEMYEDVKGTWEKSSLMKRIFPKMLEYLYAHRYNDEADAIIEALLKERLDEEIKKNFSIISEKYKH